jgi:glycolate oxidase iron-sulfur subunit
MLHSIPPNSHGSFTTPMTHAIEACVHCGFCLAACPTYRELGQEMDTPRGRIILMKQVLEGALSWQAAQPHIDRCLGCLACEPACPSGVPYRELISPFRSVAQRHARRSFGQRFQRALVAQTIPYPWRLRLMAILGQFAKRLILPERVRAVLELLPDEVKSSAALPPVTQAKGERRARVALLLGCAQQVFAPEINAATVEILAQNGVEVVIPSGQGCCGGLSWHTGDSAAAQEFARQNLEAFSGQFDAILTNAAGCGSAMHEYPLILRSTAQEKAAKALAGQVQDVSLFLARLGLRDLPRQSERRLRIVYQDACHLLNGQQVRAEPRSLLQSIPGVELCELPDAHLCCGSAGTYNIEQPELAARLGQAKAKSALALNPDLLATGNIGCLLQLRAHLKKLGSSLPVRHTMEVLRDAYDPVPD